MKYTNYLVKFKYADSLSNWEWRDQSCVVSALGSDDAVKKCKDLYGLGIDCKYRIISVEAH